MPKVKWQGDIDADAIESAEGNSGYAGENPPSGIYRFKLRRSKVTESSTGKPMLSSVLLIDGTWKAEHKQYNGAPFFDHMTIEKSTAWRVKAFCDALNITAQEFMSKMVADDEGIVQKIGKLKIADEDLLVMIKVKAVGAKNGYEAKLELVGYLPFKEEEESTDEADDDDDSDDSDDDPPF